MFLNSFKLGVSKKKNNRITDYKNLNADMQFVVVITS